MDPSRLGGRLLNRPAALIAGAVVAAVLAVALLVLLTLSREDPGSQDLVVAGPKEAQDAPVVTEAEPDSLPESGEDETLPDNETEGDESEGGEGDTDLDPPDTAVAVAGIQETADPADPPPVRPGPLRPAPIPTTTTTRPRPDLPPLPPIEPPTTEPSTTEPVSTTTTTVPFGDLFIPDVEPPPDPVAGAGRATIDTAWPVTGDTPEHPRQIQVTVAEEPNAGIRLFLMCNVSQGGATTWFGKAELSGTGQHQVTASFRDPIAAPPGATTDWVCAVVSADAVAAEEIGFLKQMDDAGIVIDPDTFLPFDIRRQTLPTGAVIISNQVGLQVPRTTP